MREKENEIRVTPSFHAMERSFVAKLVSEVSQVSLVPTFVLFYKLLCTFQIFVRMFWVMWIFLIYFFEILHRKLAHARPKLMHLRMPDA